MIKELSVEDLAAWRASEQSFVLLDVREHDEVATAAIAGAVHVPMREIPQRIGDFEKHARIAVLCHHGGRSERVAQYLVTNGFTDVSNVEGGIDAYSRIVDPSIPRYR